jgi:acetyl esterase/lipase
MKNRRIYFESSPISYATVDRTRTRFLLVHGTTDDVVDLAQSKDFLVALNQAGISVRRIVVPGAGHFWASDPFEGEPGSYGACRRRGSCDFYKAPCSACLGGFGALRKTRLALQNAFLSVRTNNEQAAGPKRTAEAVHSILWTTPIGLGAGVAEG